MKLRDIQGECYDQAEKASKAIAAEYAKELVAEIPWLNEDAIAEWIEKELVDGVGVSKTVRDCLGNLLGRAIKCYERALRQIAAKELIEIDP